MSLINVDIDIRDICCPITNQIFLDPVLAHDGFTYEKDAIKKWLGKNDTSPMTGLQIDNLTFIENILIKNTITNFIDKDPNLKKQQYQKEKEICTFNFVIESILEKCLDIDTIESIIDLKDVDYNKFKKVFLNYNNINELIKKIDKNEFSVIIDSGGENYVRIINLVIHQKCDIDIIKYVMDNTPNIDYVNNCDRTILDRIIVNNNVTEIVEYLFKKSTNFNIFSNVMDKHNVFVELCKMSNTNKYIHDCLVLMINNNLEYFRQKCGTSINGDLYIHNVCQFGTKEIMELLYAGSNFNCENNMPKTIFESKSRDGKTCMEIACEHLNLQIIEYLLDKDVDLLWKNSDEKNILHYFADISNINFDVCEKMFKKYSEQLKNSKIE